MALVDPESVPDVALSSTPVVSEAEVDPESTPDVAAVEPASEPALCPPPRVVLSASLSAPWVAVGDDVEPLGPVISVVPSPPSRGGTVSLSLKHATETRASKQVQRTDPA